MDILAEQINHHLDSELSNFYARLGDQPEELLVQINQIIEWKQPEMTKCLTNRKKTTQNYQIFSSQKTMEPALGADVDLLYSSQKIDTTETSE